MILSRDQRDVLKLMSGGYTLKAVPLDKGLTCYLENGKGSAKMLGKNMVKGLQLIRLINKRFDEDHFSLTDKGQLIADSLRKGRKQS